VMSEKTEPAPAKDSPPDLGQLPGKDHHHEH
jgi:hypothetical protein